MTQERLESFQRKMEMGKLEGGIREQGLPLCIERWQSHLAIYSSTRLLKRWNNVGNAGLYTAVGESWKYDHEARSVWGQQKLRPMENRERCVLIWTEQRYLLGWIFVFRKSWVLGEMHDVAGLGVFPTKRFSFLEGLRFYSLFSGHLALAAKELWRTVVFFRKAMRLTSSA